MLSVESIPRCPHGIYAPDHGRAESCRLCFPDGYPHRDCGPVVLPYNSGIKLNGHNRMRANGKEAGMCPGCGSRIHTVQSRTQWCCADCGKVYEAPKGLKGIPKDEPVAVCA